MSLFISSSYRIFQNYHHLKHLTHLILKLVNIGLHAFLYFTPILHFLTINTSYIGMSQNICCYYVSVDFILMRKLYKNAKMRINDMKNENECMLIYATNV